MTEEKQITVWDALEARYSLPHYVFLREVKDSTGFHSTRSADALAVSLYVSRGQALTAFEVKHSRADWLGELRKPDKAETIGKFCDFFFLVTADKAMVKPEEIPAPWGWMAFTGKKVRVLKQAKQLKSHPLDRAMMASLIFRTMRRFQGETLLAQKQAIEEGIKEAHRSLVWQLERSKEDYAKLEKKVQDFEAASGVGIMHTYHDIGKIGEVVKLVLNGRDGLQEYREQLLFFHRRAASLTQMLESELKTLPEAKKGEEVPVLTG
jgi:hypothetical protein